MYIMKLLYIITNISYIPIIMMVTVILLTCQRSDLNAMMTWQEAGDKLAGALRRPRGGRVNFSR